MGNGERRGDAVRGDKGTRGPGRGGRRRSSVTTSPLSIVNCQLSIVHCPKPPKLTLTYIIAVRSRQENCALADEMVVNQAFRAIWTKKLREGTK